MVHNEADADDIAQETMVKLYLNIDALDEDRVEGWVRVAAKNLGIDYQRKAQRFDWNELDEDLRAEEMELPTLAEEEKQEEPAKTEPPEGTPAGKETAEKEMEKIPVINDVSECILCGKCTGGCPGSALEIDRVNRTWSIDPAACVQCGICVENCPKQCLSMNKEYVLGADDDIPEPISFALPERKRPSQGKPAVKPDA